MFLLESSELERSGAAVANDCLPVAALVGGIKEDFVAALGASSSSESLLEELAFLIGAAAGLVLAGAGFALVGTRKKPNIINQGRMRCLVGVCRGVADSSGNKSIEITLFIINANMLHENSVVTLTTTKYIGLLQSYSSSQMNTRL